MKRTPLKRSGFLKRTPFLYHGRKAEDRVTKGGRVILNQAHYTGLCQEIWVRDRGECQIKHGGCWGVLPGFSTQFIDHKIKRSQQGSDSLENCRLACPPCHSWLDNQGGKLLERQTNA